MDEGTILGVLERIEAALDKLETSVEQRRRAAAAEPTPAEMADVESEVVPGLAERHQALRTTVQTTLARLDALLTEQAR